MSPFCLGYLGLRGTSWIWGHVTGLWVTTIDLQSPNAASLLQTVADPGQPCWDDWYISTASAMFCQDGWGNEQRHAHQSAVPPAC